MPGTEFQCPERAAYSFTLCAISSALTISLLNGKACDLGYIILADMFKVKLLHHSNIAKRWQIPCRSYHYIFLKIYKNPASERAQHAKVLATKSDNLSLIPGTGIMEGEKRFPQVVLQHMCCSSNSTL